MITSQAELDRCLDRTHTVGVEISPAGGLRATNLAYDAIRNLPESGFSFTARDLLHAIGCKTAAIPASPRDECLKSAWLYTHILDLEAPYLHFQGSYGSDLQASRSQEVGIGFTCLLAERYFHIPWDQLGSLPAIGKRFDYRGTNGQVDCIFECKGTSRIEYQSSQIHNGLEKKNAYHARGEHFDVELIISSFIGRTGEPPNIVLADPDKRSLKQLYGRGDDLYYRLKHYCRVLQFIGLPESAYRLNLYALEYLQNKRSVYRTIMDEKRDRGFLETITIGGDQFLGRWFDSWLPKASTRYKRLYEKQKDLRVPFLSAKRSVFQGLRRDVYESGLGEQPFSRPLLEKRAIQKYHRFEQARVSVFPDATVMVFRQI